MSERSRFVVSDAAWEKVLLMAPTDFPAINAMSEVAADLFRKLGMNLDYVATDWGSALRRQANRDVPARGGYNAFCTYTGPRFC